ncbi:NAD(P)/FAD-dependent oxidoreductase [Candidatus Saccharibacteria bacterium]|nr:NAD(P)/FAD-dependent oxidoreductase [Candidatus Saccharibacteria bacterium]
MSKNYDYDYIIIGSGPAGRTAALRLATAKKKVAIVDFQNFGGTEINTRDLPYELSLNFAKSYHDFGTSPAASGSSCHFNFPTLQSTIETQISIKRDSLVKEFKEKHITLIHGFAHFLDKETIAVGEYRYTAKNFILSSGSKLKATEIAGLDSVKFWSPDNVLSQKRLPKFVFVVGGGPTGVQIAEYFAMLGVGVIIMERGSHLLPREDEDVSSAISDYFTRVLGITIVTNAKVTAITEDYASKIVVFMNGTNEKMVRVDSIVLATGSEPFLDYGLENAGVDYKRTGIIVDKYFNTTAKNIYAIGDATSGDSSTERSSLEANILATNLLHRQKIVIKQSDLPRCINISEEIATIGLNERDLLARDIKCKRSVVYLKDIPTLTSPIYQHGFVKLLTDHSGRLLGATIVAPGAKSIIGELSLAKSHKQSLESLASITHPANSPATAITLAAKKLL